MADKWTQVEFGELLLNGTRNGVYKEKAFHGRGVKIVNMGELFANPRLFDVPMKLVELTNSELERSSLQAGDLLFARRSLVAEGAGKCSIVMEVKEPTTFESSIIRARPDGTQANSLFLYYLFNSPQGRYLLGTILRQVAVSGITGTDLVKLKVSKPPLKEQQAIACILGALDDKIELNRRMNQTLEAVALEIFKSWFVNFDPVHSNASGQQLPGLKPEIASLFPDSFQDSVLGEIPKGWTTIPLYDTATFINGAAFRNEDFCLPGEGLPIIKIAELKIGISSQTKWSVKQANPGQLINTGDLLYSWSGSPDTSLDAFLWTNGAGLLNQHIFKVLTQDIVQKRFVYYLLKLLRPVLIETARNKQTTGLGHVTVADMKRLKVCWPSSAILDKFNSLTGAFFDRAFGCLLETRTLSALRDALLPKLISGELELKDAELIAGRCA